MFEPGTVEGNSVNTTLEQSQKNLPNPAMQGGDVPTTFKANG